MFNALTALGWGVVTFAITIGVGVTVLSKFGGALAECNATYPTFNYTDSTCWNTTDTGYTPTAGAFVTTSYLNTQLGTTGLAGWTPAIIAFSVGMLFLGGFVINRSKGRNY